MYQQILVAVDGSETSSRALEHALQLARDCGACLQPLYVVDVPLLSYDVPGYDPSHIRNALFDEGRQVLDDAVAKMAAAGVQGTAHIVETAVVTEDIAHCIQRVATDLKADIVVIGTHGRRGFQRLVLGSVAGRFLRIARCPVLTISSQCPNPAESGAQTAFDAVEAS
jgi:nucleotide-binding universal stress UspA family protein